MVCVYLFHKLSLLVIILYFRARFMGISSWRSVRWGEVRWCSFFFIYKAIHRVSSQAAWSSRRQVWKALASPLSSCRSLLKCGEVLSDSLMPVVVCAWACTSGFSNVQPTAAVHPSALCCLRHEVRIPSMSLCSNLMQLFFLPHFTDKENEAQSLWLENLTLD